MKKRKKRVTWFWGLEKSVDVGQDDEKNRRALDPGNLKTFHVGKVWKREKEKKKKKRDRERKPGKEDQILKYCRGRE